MGRAAKSHYEGDGDKRDRHNTWLTSAHSFMESQDENACFLFILSPCLTHFALSLLKLNNDIQMFVLEPQ